MSSLSQLREALKSGMPQTDLGPKPSESNSIDYAIWRFLSSMSTDQTIGPDHAVLLRQILRWHNHNKLFVGRVDERFSKLAENAGVRVRDSGDLIATPFAPDWLENNGLSEGDAIDEKPEDRRTDESILAEPYLHSIGGFNRWQSLAQKEAVWKCISAPEGSSTLIALPTGSGKSLCFQALSKFGSGLTVVIVPTIALAIDQYQSSRELLTSLPGVNPLYFASDSKKINADAVVESVRNRTTRLIFTSPEACVSGRLRSVLEVSAADGYLENLVIDEAHIIESWGIFFRVDFQMLSVLRKQWLELSQNRLKTYLLSATFTKKTRQVLKNLFGSDSTEWREFISQRIRPEIKYFRSHFNNESTRMKAVNDCLWKLPRPAIFYTTEVEAANELVSDFREQGFSRVGCFTGETGSTERYRLLEDWRSDRIDLMVATSAFGMGVDKSDVRSIVHACLPENIHRYYQEVGRSGRDGRSSIAMLLSSDSDLNVAKGLAPKLLREDTLQARWEGLWRNKEDVKNEDRVWKLPMNAKRLDLLGTRTYSENVLWNKRLILMLLRAGLLTLEGIEYRDPDEGDLLRVEWVKVGLTFSPNSPDIGSRMRETREEELFQYRIGLEDMINYVFGRHSLCRSLRRLYGRSTGSVCGGCPDCRKVGRKYLDCPALTFDESPDSNPNFVQVTDVTNPIKFPLRIKRNLRILISHKRINRFAVSEDSFEELLNVFEKTFNETDTDKYRLDRIRENEHFQLDPYEEIAIFHIEKLNRRALKFTKGRTVTHLICEGVNYRDNSGRSPGEADGWRIFSTLEGWI